MDDLKHQLSKLTLTPADTVIVRFDGPVPELVAERCAAAVRAQVSQGVGVLILESAADCFQAPNAELIDVMCAGFLKGMSEHDGIDESFEQFPEHEKAGFRVAMAAVLKAIAERQVRKVRT